MESVTLVHSFFTDDEKMTETVIGVFAKFDAAIRMLEIVYNAKLLIRFDNRGELRHESWYNDNTIFDLLAIQVRQS